MYFVGRMDNAHVDFTHVETEFFSLIIRRLLAGKAERKVEIARKGKK
jgi:hypothetical protein